MGSGEAVYGLPHLSRRPEGITDTPNHERVAATVARRSVSANNTAFRIEWSRKHHNHVNLCDARTGGWKRGELRDSLRCDCKACAKHRIEYSSLILERAVVLHLNVQLRHPNLSHHQYDSRESINITVLIVI